MKKRSGWKIAALASVSIMGLLPSNDASALFGLDEATRYEQLVQIGIAEKQLEHLFQMLSALPIGQELMQVFRQMENISIVVEEAVSYEPPVELIERHETLSPFDHARLVEERERFLEEADYELRMVEADLMLDDTQMETLMLASKMAAEPPSDIVATQAQFLGDASRLEQQRRAIAVEAIRQKRTDLRRQMEEATHNSRLAAAKCVRDESCITSKP